MQRKVQNPECNSQKQWLLISKGKTEEMSANEAFFAQYTLRHILFLVVPLSIPNGNSVMVISLPTHFILHGGSCSNVSGAIHSNKHILLLPHLLLQTGTLCLQIDVSGSLTTHPHHKCWKRLSEAAFDIHAYPHSAKTERFKRSFTFSILVANSTANNMLHKSA